MVPGKVSDQLYYTQPLTLLVKKELEAETTEKDMQPALLATRALKDIY